MNLQCPYCAGVLFIVCEHVGRPYLSENTPVAIECNGPPDGYGCGAEWTTDGTLSTPGRPPVIDWDALPDPPDWAELEWCDDGASCEHPACLDALHDSQDESVATGVGR